jgi:iron complex transport system ATP-binding protein
MVNQDTLLQIEAAGFGYTGKTVLSEVAFSVQEGEFVCVIGPNGAGKSTLIKSILGILPAHAGTVRILGTLLENWGRRDLARHLALVPQDTELPPVFTVREAVEMGRTPHLGFLGSSTANDRAIVEQALRHMDLIALSESRVGEISGGERQRVFLARALAQNPRLLLLDEPTAHMDIHRQIEAAEILREYTRREGTAAIAVFHDLNLAAGFCDRIILIGNGTVFTRGTPGEVFRSAEFQSVYRDSVVFAPREDLPGIPAVLPRGHPGGMTH